MILKIHYRESWVYLEAERISVFFEDRNKVSEECKKQALNYIDYNDKAIKKVKIITLIADKVWEVVTNYACYVLNNDGRTVDSF